MKRVIAGKLGLDRAVSFSLLQRLMQACMGVLGLILISRYFSAQVQGFYYTFASLVALQSFLEFGLGLVISNFASHEWSRLKLSGSGEINGDAQALSKLVSMGRFYFKWYAAAAILFLVFGGAGGYWFLSQAGISNLNWQTPWLLNVTFSAVLFFTMPFFSLLEGCNQIAEVARFRFFQVAFCNSIFCLSIVMGAGIAAAPILSGMLALCSVYYLVIRRRAFFRPFRSPPSARELFNWKRDMLPMQWRMGVQGIMNYFVFSLFTPVLFQYHGPEVAGQMGMSLQLINSLQAVASIWVLTKAPSLGILVARRDFAALDREWKKATIFSIAIMMIGVLSLLTVVLLMMELRLDMISRLLPPTAIVMLGVGAIFSIGVQSMSVYLRAHKKELLLPTVLVSGLAMGFLVWYFGARYGALGACASYLFVYSCITFPMVYWTWNKAKYSWHS